MPAPFAKDLCGYRGSPLVPNTSDASDAFSVEVGAAMFDAMGVERSTRAEEPTGTPFSQKVDADLTAQLKAVGSTLDVQTEKRLALFEQFRHVDALRGFTAEPSRPVQQGWRKVVRFLRSKVTAPPRDVTRRDALIDAFEQALADETALRRQIVEDLGEESLLGLDVTVSRTPPEAWLLPHLEAGLSLKWSLRTDRAQDCRSQGAKMAALRRGRMPHFAAVTIEPRPYFLNILGGGSGEIDCVYHLDLPALELAIEATCKGKPRRAKTADTFRRLVEQRRLRDYGELVEYLETL